jgi:hypothetical protein
VRPADEVDRGRPPGLVHRHGRVAVAGDPFPPAERLVEGVTESSEHVLGRVVLVHAEIAGRQQLEVEARLEGEQGQQMVEEADTGRDPGAAAAVQVEREAQRRLGARADDERVAPRRGRRAGSQGGEQDVVLARAAQRDPDPASGFAHDEPL